MYIVNIQTIYLYLHSYKYIKIYKLCILHINFKERVDRKCRIFIAL